MRNLRTYLARKCSSQKFKAQYERFCTVCETTAAIVGKMYVTGVSGEEMDLQTGLAAENLRRLENADWCRIDDIRTLCRELGVEEPRQCVRLNSGE